MLLTILAVVLNWTILGAAFLGIYLCGSNTPLKRFGGNGIRRNRFTKMVAEMRREGILSDVNSEKRPTTIPEDWQNFLNATEFRG